MSKGSSLQRMVKRSKGFRLSNKKEKLNIAYKVLFQIAQGTSEEAKLAKATLLVLEE